MRYYYDDQRVLLETDATGTEHDVRYFIYGNFVDEVLIMTDVDSGNSVADGDYYYGHDHLFSPVVLFSSAGAPVERYEYDAYGKARIMDASYGSRSTSSYSNPYLFTGRRLDTLDGGDLKIMYYRARTYDTITGRFLQRDPLGVRPDMKYLKISPRMQYLQGMGLYQYVGSNPVNSFDPDGLWRRIKTYKGTMRDPKICDSMFPECRYEMEYEVEFEYGCDGCKEDHPYVGPVTVKKSNVSLPPFPLPDGFEIAVGIGFEVENKISAYATSVDGECPPGKCGDIAHATIHISWVLEGNVTAGFEFCGIGFSCPIYESEPRIIKTHKKYKDVKCCY